MKSSGICRADKLLPQVPGLLTAETSQLIQCNNWIMIDHENDVSVSPRTFLAFWFPIVSSRKPGEIWTLILGSCLVYHSPLLVTSGISYHHRVRRPGLLLLLNFRFQGLDGMLKRWHLAVMFWLVNSFVRLRLFYFWSWSHHVLRWVMVGAWESGTWGRTVCCFGKPMSPFAHDTSTTYYNCTYHEYERTNKQESLSHTKRRSISIIVLPYAIAISLSFNSIFMYTLPTFPRGRVETFLLSMENQVQKVRCGAMRCDR